MSVKEVRAYDLFGKGIYDGDCVVVPDTTKNVSRIPFLIFGVVQEDKVYYLDHIANKLRYMWLYSKNKIDGHNIVKMSISELTQPAVETCTQIKALLANKGVK